MPWSGTEYLVAPMQFGANDKHANVNFGMTGRIQLWIIALL